MENKTQFKVIKGGLLDSPMNSKKEFISAYITDTRLMGVVVIGAHWYLPENFSKKHFHQFFYLDAEETGFDSYESVLEADDDDGYDEIVSIESSMLGGLGGKKVSIDEREVRYMIQNFAQLNKKSGLPLPEGYDEYSFLLSPKIEFSYEEKYALMCRQCPILQSPYQVINYFLMRCFGRDFGAAKFLTKNYVRTDIFSEHKAATLLTNSIDKADDDQSGTNTGYYCTDNDKDFGTFNTRKSYMCRSLIEYDAKYFLIVTQITLDKLKVVKYEKISSLRVSTAEASMITSHEEHITVFDYIGSGTDFDTSSTRLSRTSMVTDHTAGRLFMIFFPHNDHVDRQEYRLSDDVLGLYYVLDDGQIIISSNDAQSIEVLEKDLLSSKLSSRLIPLSKYCFREPVLYDFISSGMDDFEGFVDMISVTEDDDE